MASGIDMPTMNRKAGKTRSTKVIELEFSGACLIHAGMPC